MLNRHLSNSFIKLLLILFVLMLSQAISAAPKSELWAFWQKSSNDHALTIDHSRWSQMLQAYLVTNHPSGVNRFRYNDVSEQSQHRLDEYLAYLQQLDPREYSKAEQKAYWLNLYNAFTVDLILSAYPVKSIKRVRGGLFNTGPWREKLIRIAGQKLSLNDIEHRILRPIWNDPRIHFGVNCASMGCPNLLEQPFTASNTDALLNKAANNFIHHSRGVRFESEHLVLSKIFDWYQEDFGDNEAAMLNTLSTYAAPALADKLRQFDGTIKYQYDWKLNQP